MDEAVEVEEEAEDGITSRCTEVGGAEGVEAGKIAERPADILATVDQLRMLQCTRPIILKSTSLSVTTR